MIVFIFSKAIRSNQTLWSILTPPCDSMIVKPIFTIPCEGQSTSITLQVKGGSPPYFYEINNSDFILLENPLQDIYAGEYSIKIKDSSSCYTEKTTFIVEEKNCKVIPKAFNPSYTDWVYESNDKEVELKIINFNGIEVYKVTGINPSWNGQDIQGNTLPMDPYMYFIYFEGSLLDRGEITLIR